jgi:hypothetical protein
MCQIVEDQAILWIQIPMAIPEKGIEWNMEISRWIENMMVDIGKLDNLIWMGESPFLCFCFCFVSSVQYLRGEISAIDQTKDDSETRIEEKEFQRGFRSETVLWRPKIQMTERYELKWSLLTKMMDKELQRIRCYRVSPDDNIEVNVDCLSFCQSFAIEVDQHVVKLSMMNMKMF